MILTSLKLILLTLLVSFSSARAEELGRLFFTSAQRQQLELATQQIPTPIGAPHTLAVDGIVQKHGGSRTVWLNGAMQEGRVDMTRAPDRELLIVHGISSPIAVKVGQRVFVPPNASDAKR